jgi:ribonuclease T
MALQGFPGARASGRPGGKSWGGVTGLSLDELEQSGEPPQVAMRAFANWVNGASGKGIPVFVGLNAAFDWSFINYYFHRFLGENPFGFTALDIKSLYMGMTGSSWHDTRSSKMIEVLKPNRRTDHHALGDAEAQGELFELILKRIRG